MKIHCLKSVCIRSYSDPHFPAFGLNTDQNNSENGHFLRIDIGILNEVWHCEPLMRQNDFFFQLLFFFSLHLRHFYIKSGSKYTLKQLATRNFLLHYTESNWCSGVTSTSSTSPINIAFNFKKIAINVRYAFLTSLVYCLLSKISRRSVTQ